MFKQRLFTSIVLSILVVGLVLSISETTFKIILMFLLLLASWEWSRLINLEKIGIRILYSLLVLVLIYVLPDSGIVYYFGFAVFCWLLLLTAVMLYPQSSIICANQYLSSLLGIILFSVYALALITLRGKHNGAELVLYLIAIVLAADVGAYTFGNLLGRHKLALKLSPGKTWEGTLFGLLSAMMVAVAGGVYFGIDAQQWLAWLLLAGLTAIASVIGDLSESLFKRYRGVKGSGRLLPGHGGILDRIDGHLAAAPVFVFFFIMMNL